MRRRSQHTVSHRLAGWLMGALWWIPSVQTAASDVQSIPSLTDAARQFLAELSSSKARIIVDELDSRLRLPACGSTLEASLATGARPSGRTNVAVRCRTPRPWLVYVPATVHTVERVVVIKRALTRGTTLSAEDVDLAEREQGTAVNPSTLRRLEQALGQQLTRSVVEGTALTKDMVQPPLLVRRGAQVVIRARAEDFEVSMPGTALGDATEGARVRVKNLNSQRIVEGHVMTDGSVQVPM